MRRTKKDPTIQLPLSVTLTDDGKYFFNRRSADEPAREKSFVGDEIRLKSFNAKTFQRMIYAGYVSRVELSRSDFLSKRKEIMDVAKLIAYSILYKKFGMMLGKGLSDTTMIVSWNRKYPQRSLNENTMVGEGEKVSGHEEVLDTIGNLVRRTVSELSNEDESISSEEREVYRLKAERFLESLNPLLWGLLIKQSEGKEKAAVCREIEEVLKNFLRKTVIADYLSLLIVELAEYAETSLLKKAVDDDPHEQNDFTELVKNQEARNRVLNRMEKSRRHATLAWRIQGQRFTLGADKSTQILLYNRVVNSREVRQEIEEVNNINRDDSGLADFYNQGEEESAGRLGLSYLAYLDEACSALGVRFDSYAKYISDLDINLISLSIRL